MLPDSTYLTNQRYFNLYQNKQIFIGKVRQAGSSDQIVLFASQTKSLHQLRMCGYNYYKDDQSYQCVKCPGTGMFSIDSQSECLKCTDTSPLANPKYSDFQRAKFKALCNTDYSNLTFSVGSPWTVMIVLSITVLLLCFFLILLVVYLRKRGFRWVI